MRDRLGLIFLGIAALLLVGVVLFVVLRARPANGPETAVAPANTLDGDGSGEPEDGEEHPDIQVSGTELTISEDGEVIWRATFGGEIELDEEHNIASATDVLWEFEGPGFEGLSLKAPRMRADWNEQRLRFSDGIAIEGEGGSLRFSADTAEYQFDTHKVIGRGNVRFQRGNYYGRAEEVVVDNSRRVVRLKRGSLFAR